MKRLRFEHLTEEQLKRLAEKIARNLRGREILILAGGLGVGKTTFVKGLVKGLGLKESVVKSPTFTLMNVYPGVKMVYHLDLYRLHDPDFLFLDVEDVLEDEDGILVVEWGDLFESFWPEDAIKIKLEMVDEVHRNVEVLIPEEVNYLAEALEGYRKEFQNS
ncbi:tRNA (adenosine(37)-N6)-threonylcarbamoyltransferase complex ATPase subunit type 1 TsaE [Thermotoga sp. KOL6]|uniref:tRNA (adenosine(37)-N6)-threonylcarbamoyltransferase complex ATPase subunit type 1 TsaE n=1 Tax=Thermotoga sp. KOL6 TaxID=126741 RepID=UPI000C75CECC|nr:tRNA (adenosine(37)-N6)-threonylcarbamoyltransferase complex ATPase subunit type 1 TsaE [Thermotoga sp. KOL6]PLV60284.1 tRNA threonylcarbamoyladenosine biosynthesis protein TsaE [Thermotoga sp. KOL6]